MRIFFIFYDIFTLLNIFFDYFLLFLFCVSAFINEEFGQKIKLNLNQILFHTLIIVEVVKRNHRTQWK